MKAPPEQYTHLDEAIAHALLQRIEGNAQQVWFRATFPNWTRGHQEQFLTEKSGTDPIATYAVECIETATATRGRRVLDVGSGSGGLAELLAQRGGRI